MTFAGADAKAPGKFDAAQGGIVGEIFCNREVGIESGFLEHDAERGERGHWGFGNVVPGDGHPSGVRRQLPGGRDQQAVASLAMKAGIVGYGLDDVGRMGGKRAELVDHHIRRGCLDRGPYRLRIERIGAGGRDPQFAETIHARTGACHAGHLMAECAQRVDEWQAHSACSAGNKYLHDELLGYLRLGASAWSYFSSAACGVMRKLIAMRL